MSFTNTFTPDFSELFGILNQPQLKGESPKEKLEERIKELKKKFNESEGQTKFKYLVELASLEAELKNLL